jgi:hypothetical protein
VVEAEDHETRIALARCRLPPGFDIIVVPQALPLTKPKALNYALTFARGSLLTVFDAEDVPDPGQLRLAADIFAASGPELACLQARLAFYNPHQNWLTRQLAIEYAVLFDLQLPMLSALSCAFPLGGTSNHFRTVALKRVGRWDPHNVTEDADLGFRLARHGYRCRMIAASTREEANVALANWLHQRARWLKGFLQTWLVHMRNPLRLRRCLARRAPGLPGDDHRRRRLGAASSRVPGLLAAEIAGGSFPPERPELPAPRLRHRPCCCRRAAARRGSCRHPDTQSWPAALVAHGHAALLAADFGRRLSRPVAVPAPSPRRNKPAMDFRELPKDATARRITGSVPQTGPRLTTAAMERCSWADRTGHPARQNLPRPGSGEPAARRPCLWASRSGCSAKATLSDTWQRNRFVVIQADGLDLTVHRLADEAKEPLLIDARDVTRSTDSGARSHDAAEADCRSRCRPARGAAGR